MLGIELQEVAMKEARPSWVSAWRRDTRVSYGSHHASALLTMLTGAGLRGLVRAQAQELILYFLLIHVLWLVINCLNEEHLISKGIIDLSPHCIVKQKRLFREHFNPLRNTSFVLTTSENRFCLL